MVSLKSFLKVFAVVALLDLGVNLMVREIVAAPMHSHGSTYRDAYKQRIREGYPQYKWFPADQTPVGNDEYRWEDTGNRRNRRNRDTGEVTEWKQWKRIWIEEIKSK